MLDRVDRFLLAAGAVAVALRMSTMDPVDAVAVGVPAVLIGFLWYGIHVRGWPWDVVCTAAVVAWAVFIVGFVTVTGLT